MANLNTVATRQRAAAVLGSVFGGTRGATMELLDKAPFAVVLADDGKIASVCVFEIVPVTRGKPFKLRSSCESAAGGCSSCVFQLRFHQLRV